MDNAAGNPVTDRLSFASIRVITDDVVSLVKFYERVTGISATWANDVFAELSTPAATLAVASSSTMALFGPEVAHAADNQSVIIEFLVANVDADHDRLRALDELDLTIVQAPTTMPWGNRSLLFRDPDGNLVNFFTPVTPEAIQRFQR
jgi:catechol 2,3-dioxygenase-like lactoylglutathione lyase family enzyme